MARFTGAGMVATMSLSAHGPHTCVPAFSCRPSAAMASLAAAYSVCQALPKRAA
jgi:hypothetical protein